MSDPANFRPLGEFEWPTTAVNRGFDLAMTQFRKKFRRNDKDGGVDPKYLVPPPPELLDRVCEPPSHFPLISELDETFDAWLSDTASTDRAKMIVLPPCDRDDLLSHWAETHDLQVFGTDRLMAELDGLDDPGATPLVIPKLECRFLRTRSGLHDIRRLLDRLSGMERRIIMGCNSWAWQFLRKSCEIDLIFSAPMTFHAFDKQRLRNWLGALSLDSKDTQALCFRSASSGRDVFGNGQGETEISAYMTDLAKASIGVPWVAWHLWKESLHTLEPTEDNEEPVNDKQAEADPRETIWVTDIKPPTVPNRNDQNAFLVLHALLIHGGLTLDQIVQTVPLVTYTHVLASLVQSKLIDKVDGVYRCIPAAYPVIRDGLSNAGYPVDIL